MVNLRKNETDFLEDRSDTMLYQIQLESFENCHFHDYSVFSNGSYWPSRTAQLHKFERTPFADQSDCILLKSVKCYLRYWQFGKTGLANRKLVTVT